MLQNAKFKHRPEQRTEHKREHIAHQTEKKNTEVAIGKLTK